MKRSTLALSVLSIALPFSIAGHLDAHGLVLLPDRPGTSPRERVELTLFVGHAFEHQVLAAPRPETLDLHLPDGGKEDLLSRLRPAAEKGPDGKESAVLRFDIQPAVRGDLIVALAGAPRAGDGEDVVRDFARVTVHVQAERGWERALGQRLEVVPLARPYGIRPGGVFTAQVRFEGRPLEGAAVEIERYNPAPPARLPEEEFITRTARSGPGGAVSATLDETGWWAVTAVHRAGEERIDGKPRLLTLRATLWVYAGEPLKPER